MIENLNGTKETINFLGNSTIKLYNNIEEEDYPLHWHTSLEIIMPVENIYTASCNNEKYILQKGDILLIGPGVLHKLISPPSGKRYIFQADLAQLNSLKEFETIASLLSPVVLITPSNSPRIYERVQHMFYNIIEEYENEEIYRDSMIYSRLISIFSVIARNQSADKYLSISSSKQYKHPKIFISVLSYINNHFSENITLEQAASLAGFSKYHFSRAFKQYAGISFYQYVNKKRIMYAASLLMDRDISITEVSLQCGFTSISAFIRMFKIHKGCTPSEFKGMHTA